MIKLKNHVLHKQSYQNLCASLKKENASLRQRVDKLEEENGNLRKQLQISYEQEVNSRGREALRDARDKWMRKAMDAEKRVAELEEELISPVIESEWQELQRKYKERGERMKLMKAHIRDYKKLPFVKWFDSEGEPL